MIRLLDRFVAPRIWEQFGQIGRFVGDLHRRLDARDRQVDELLDGLRDATSEIGGRLARLEAMASGVDGSFFRSRRAPEARPLLAAPVGAVVVVVDPREPEFGRIVAEQGAWEPVVASVILRSLEPGAVFVDIGANVGVMSLQAAARVGPQGRVLAFEPNPDNLDCLLRGVTANDFRNVTVYPFGLSDGRRTVALVGGSNTHLASAPGSGRRALTLPGDDILADEVRIDLVKIDVEGHEPFVLDGLSRTLRAHGPRVLCEFNPRCLRDHAGRSPDSFAAQLFAMTSALDVIAHDGSVAVVDSPETLLRLWDERNREAVASGFLPDGMLHFDLLFRAEPDRMPTAQ